MSYIEIVFGLTFTEHSKRVYRYSQTNQKSLKSCAFDTKTQKAADNPFQVKTLENHIQNLDLLNIPAVRYLPHHFKTWSKVSKILSSPPTDKSCVCFVA